MNIIIFRAPSVAHSMEWNVPILQANLRGEIQETIRDSSVQSLVTIAEYIIATMPMSVAYVKLTCIYSNNNGF